MYDVARRALASALVLTFTTGLVLAASAARAEESAVEEILVILKQRGLIDAGEHERLLAKHRAERESGAPAALPSVAGIAERLEWSGDLRLRYEAYRFQHDATGVDRDDRDRLRYRARLGLAASVNDRVELGFRLVSGGASPTSTNQTLGSATDFDTDDLRLDRAFAAIDLGRAAGIDAEFVGGKMPNPFRWKHGRDILLWDGDISPEGGALRLETELSESTSLFSNLAYFVDVENAVGADPKVIAGQLGLIRGFGDALEVGARASAYEWRSLDAPFITRAQATSQSGGNLTSAFDGRARIGEASAYLRYAGVERWPLLLYGTLARNFTADPAALGGFPLDDEQNAWLLGLEIGDSKRLARLGLGYARVEANSIVSLTTDSDMFDGFTNRKGWVAYASRSILQNTDLHVTLFRSEELLDTGAFDGCGGACGPFSSSVADAERYRLQADLMMRF